MTGPLRIDIANLVDYVSGAAEACPTAFVTVYRGRGNERTVAVTGATSTIPRTYGRRFVFAFTTTQSAGEVMAGLNLPGYRRELGDVAPYAAEAVFEKEAQ